MGIKSKIALSLEQFSPSLAAVLRKIWHRLFRPSLRDRLDQLEEQLRQQAKSTEWRFGDLKTYIQTLPKPSDTSFAVQDSVERLKQLGHSLGTAVAVVSVVPPAQTGIANFTVKAFGAAGVPVDVYFPHYGAAPYLATVHRLTNPSSPLSYFSMEALDAGLAMRGYRAVIWVLGNSDHNVEVAKMLRTARHLPSPVPSWIEIHDPVMLNLASKVFRSEGHDIVHAIKESTSADLSDVNWSDVRRGEYGQLVERGVTGIRALLGGVPFRGLIFHSQAARDFALQDWPKLDPAKVNVLFHPVFYKFEQHGLSVPRSNLRIGSFGVPGNNKGTHMVVEAFRAVRRTHSEATLLLAGYGVAQYLRDEGLTDEPGLTFEESPSNERLLELMRSVDVAVQLRLKNTGESSGVLPQLVALDRPTVASAVGALAEHGDAVCYVPAGCSPEGVAAAILEESANPERRRKAREEYVISHSAPRFCEELLTMVGSGKSTLTPVKPSADNLPGNVMRGETFGSSWDLSDPAPKHWGAFERLMQEMGLDKNDYVKTHLRRYRHTLAAIEEIAPAQDGVALEVGTSWLFAIIMRTTLGFSRVDVTDFQLGDDRKSIPVDMNYPSFKGQFQAFNVNLEGDRLPTGDEQYDLVLCCEVLEHMDVDPMFMLGELNRVMRMGGKLLLSTPNITSTRNIMKILRGAAPHFFMQYHKNRDPYRHNIEYDPKQVKILLEAAGFRVERGWTADTFEEPIPGAIDLLNRLGFPSDSRGDNMFFVAVKEAPVRDRHPLGIYT